jgi:hypothetical protein
MDIECAEQPATDECSADSDENVTDQSESGAPHHERREQSCNESDDQPGEEIHFVHPKDEGLDDRCQKRSIARDSGRGYLIPGRTTSNPYALSFRSFRGKPRSANRK